MKKFVNDPKNFVPEMLRGHRAGQPGHPHLRAGVQPDHADGRTPRRQGLDRAGLGLRPRAGPRDDRRQGHARRRLSRRRVRRAADGLRVRDRRSGSPRQKGVLLLVNNYTGDRMAFDMGKEMARPRAEGRDPDHQRRRRGQGLDLHHRPARRGRQLLRDQGGRCGLRAGRRPRRAAPDRREGQRGHPHDGRRADRLHAAGQGLAAVRARRRRDGGRRRHPRRAGPRAARSSRRPTRSSTCCSTRSGPTCPTSPATRSH